MLKIKNMATARNFQIEVAYFKEVEMYVHSRKL